jgi:hypothetical protein
VGRFTDAEHAVEPGTHEPTKPDRGEQLAFNEFGPTMNDAGSPLSTSDSNATDHPNIEPIRDIKNHHHDVPKDAETVNAGDGESFLVPPKTSFLEVYAAGQTDGLTGVNSNVGHFGRFDFQRDGDTFIDAYSNASNYAVGVYMAGAGYTWNETFLIANAFAHIMSSNAGSLTQQAWWARGWNDATHKTGPFFPLKLVIKRSCTWWR